MNNPKIDGRWFLGGSHVTLLLISYFFYDLQRTPFQIFSAYVAAFCTEIFFFHVTKKNSHRTIGDSLFSAATEAAGLLILVRSSFQFAYVIFAIVAVASKYALRLDERRHMFNPTNVAIVTGLVLIPRVYFEVRSDDFSLGLYPILHVFLFGTVAVYLGRTWMVTLSYITTAFAISFASHLATDQSLIYFIGPELGAIGFIFMFLMITDPRTTPSSKIGQAVFGSAVAVVLYVLRAYEVLYAHFLALFLVTLIRGIYETVVLRCVARGAILKA